MHILRHLIHLVYCVGCQKLCIKADWWLHEKHEPESAISSRGGLLLFPGERISDFREEIAAESDGESDLGEVPPWPSLVFPPFSEYVAVVRIEALQNASQTEPEVARESWLKALKEDFEADMAH